MSINVFRRLTGTDSPTILPTCDRAARTRRTGTTSSGTDSASSAASATAAGVLASPLRTASSSRFMLMGFVTKSTAPCCIARTALSGLLSCDSLIHGVEVLSGESGCPHSNRSKCRFA